MKSPMSLGQSLPVFVCLLFATSFNHGLAAEMNPSPPRITGGKTTNGQVRLAFPYPAAQQYQIFSAGEVSAPFVSDPNTGALLGPTFTVTNGGPSRFYKVSATSMGSNDLLIATVLNRLAYGPTPDDLDHIRAIGPQAYIDEQMASEAITDTLDTDLQITNLPPAAPPLTNWIRTSVTGTAGGVNLGMYLSGAGRVYLDNLVLVTGTVAEVGANLLVNGDFEDPVLTNGWIRGSSISASTAITNSPTVDGLAASGTNCVLLIASSGTTTLSFGLYQPFASNTPPGSFTLSFSYLPVANVGGTTNLTLTVRLSGTAATRNVQLPWLGPTPPSPPPGISATFNRLNNTDPITNATATIDDLRSYHVYRAIHSPRQLHEVLVQFFQNHFTTQYQKTEDYFTQNFSAGIYSNDNVMRSIAVDLHWREYNRFRTLLLNPNCNFYDLLRASIESPAMVLYLDTQLNTRAAPNQNYAREILELHTMGADNGYVQQDIVDLAKVWTGWRVDKKDPAVAYGANSVFAAAISRSNPTNFANAPGIWGLHYNQGSHESNAVKRLFTNVVIHPRFGESFGGNTPYALTIPNGAPAAGTNGFGEGYIVAQHLANLPYTMEFLSVKLCQWFVHEDFEYGHYDYTAPNPTPEVQLVKDCMTAWNTPAADGRKGNIRSILNVIFNSAMFRGHGASQQKVKTPLEYAASAVRALRVVSTDVNGHVVSTADSDGLGISNSGSGGTAPLSRMGGMSLFNKPEPDGWPELGSVWLNTANLCERMRFVEHLLMPTTGTTLKDRDYGNAGLRNTSDPAGLVRLKVPSGDWNNPGVLVDYFLGLIYPGEGAANLGIDRQAAIDFLNTDDAGASSPFSLTTHERRLRGMVGTLLSLPRFQEQ